MGVVRVKPGVLFSVIAPGGFRILAAADKVAQQFPDDLTITSACDGEHSGPQDPHHCGEAYDIRSHDLAPNIKTQILALLQQILGERFFCFLEALGTPNEHFHCQVRKNTKFP